MSATNGRAPRRVAVVGSGYVGTVVAACFAAIGHDVVGLEPDTQKLHQLRHGRAPFHEAQLDGLLSTATQDGSLRFTDDPADAMAAADIVFLCVGTPSGADGSPDMTAMESAVRGIGPHLRHHIIVTKSTVPLGTGRWLSSLVEESLPPGVTHEVAVVSNPEFLREGSAVEDFLHPDRVVLGSDDEAALDAVVGLYRPILDQTVAGARSRPALVRTTLITAEAVKYASNAFLATKISFINEIAGLCEVVGADVTEVAAAVGLDARIGAAFLDAGIGWGGSCFGKDLASLIATAREYGRDVPILEAAVAVNLRQRDELVTKLQEHLHTLRGRRVALLGLAFKPGTDDLRDSPAIGIAERLIARGAIVTAHDPVVRSVTDLPALRVAADPYAAAERADAVVLATEWPDYVMLDLPQLAQKMRGDVFIDGRNMFSAASMHDVGLRYVGIGRPAPRRVSVTS